MLFGYIGFFRHAVMHGYSSSIFDLFYRSAQLIVMQSGDVPPPMPWQLDIARFMLPLLAAYTAVQALISVFNEQLHFIRARYMKNHLVLCGLGQRGFYIAQEFLITSFHKVRDVALQGVVPLVFFDEFDSELNKEKLGWLKYFLAPMQDGLFRDGEVLHPLGKSIFVFAGGTRSTFEEFSTQENSQSFRDAKGSDFVSRLRGFINIKGPNPIGGDMRKDRLSMIRRATVLRFWLLKHAPQLFKAKMKCSIDRGVLHTFIKVPHYKHGIRSMQSIIEMSALAGRKRFEQTALPSPEQLELHVDAEAFQRIVMREVIFSAARENIGRAIHENYRESVQDKRPEDEISMLP